MGIHREAQDGSTVPDQGEDGVDFEAWFRGAVHRHFRISSAQVNKGRPHRRMVRVGLALFLQIVVHFRCAWIDEWEEWARGVSRIGGLEGLGLGSWRRWSGL